MKNPSKKIADKLKLEVLRTAKKLKEDTSKMAHVIAIAMKEHVEDDKKQFEDMKYCQLNSEKILNNMQTEMSDFHTRMEPVMRAFEENNIYKMTLKKDTGTLVFYTKSALTMGVLITSIWAIIKYFLLK